MFDEKTVNQLAQAVAARIIPAIQNGNGAKATPKRLLTIDEAAAYLGRSRSAVYHLIARREIPVVRHGRALRFDIRDLDRWTEGDKV